MSVAFIIIGVGVFLALAFFAVITLNGKDALVTLPILGDLMYNWRIKPLTVWDYRGKTFLKRVTKGCVRTHEDGIKYILIKSLNKWIPAKNYDKMGISESGYATLDVVRVNEDEFLPLWPEITEDNKEAKLKAHFDEGDRTFWAWHLKKANSKTQDQLGTIITAVVLIGITGLFMVLVLKQGGEMITPVLELLVEQFSELIPPLTAAMNRLATVLETWTPPVPQAPPA